MHTFTRTIATILFVAAAGMLISGCAPGPTVIPGGGEFWAKRAGSLKRPRPHHGVDYRATPGTVVIAAASGQVWNSDKGRPAAEGRTGQFHYGRQVSIIHDIPGQGLMTNYVHLDEVYVDIEDKVEKGQAIGTVGRKGIWGSIPHLHFEVWTGSRVVDPATKIGGCYKEGETAGNPEKPLVYPLPC